MHSILLSKDDHKALKDFINKYESLSLDASITSYVLALRERLNKAQIVESWDIRLIDVVTINSSVRFKNLSTQEVKEYLTVYPKLEWKSLGRLSILSDLGITLLGHKKNDIVEVKKPNGSSYEVHILNVQPTSLEWIQRLEEQC